LGAVNAEGLTFAQGGSVGDVNLGRIGEIIKPATTRPLAETRAATAYGPPNVPRSFSPPAAVHRNARWLYCASHASPTTMAPSPETPYAAAYAYPKSPRSFIPVAADHLNAR